MTTTQTVLQGKDTATQGGLYMSFELGDKSWKLTMSDGRRGPGRYNVDAGDTAAVLDCISKARARCGLSAEAKVHSCYEAGRDGWWLHRWLIEQGIDNIVVDAASIEVNRRARRAKTDRLDGDKLLTMLLRHHAGERVWSVLHEPTPEDEDARRTHRELARLMHERTAHTNRISSLLVLHNLRPRIIIGGRDWAGWWQAHGTQVPPQLCAELERESARLALVKQQIKALQAAQREAVEDGKQPLVAQLDCRPERHHGRPPVGRSWKRPDRLFPLPFSRRRARGCGNRLRRGFVQPRIGVLLQQGVAATLSR